MRKLVMGLLALSGAALVDVAGSASAMAYDYQWCVQGKETTYPGDCAYITYQQCLASASGRNVYCIENPRYAFQRPPGVPPYEGPPPRRHRY